MALISPPERLFIEAGVEQNFRSDGRERLDYRYFTLETGVLEQTNGSAKLTLDTTEVLVGIKAELGNPNPNEPKKGRIQFFVEISAGASPDMGTHQLEEQSIELSRILERIYLSALDLSKLVIVPGQRCWILYIDALILDTGGNLIDALSIATRAALYNLRLPRIEVIQGETSGEVELELSDDPHDLLQLDISRVPICITLTQIGSYYVVDTTPEEEHCMRAKIMIGISPGGRVCAMQKGGPGGVPPSVVFDMVQTAQKMGLQIHRKLERALQEEEQRRRAAEKGSQGMYEPALFFTTRT